MPPASAASAGGAVHGERGDAGGPWSDSAADGAHPYTIASGRWEETSRITFVVKDLGDHTHRLHEQLRVEQAVRVEGPYGCFTFDDGRVHQIWIGGGIGVTPSSGA